MRVFGYFFTKRNGLYRARTYRPYLAPYFLISLFSKRQFVIYCVMFVLCFSLLYPALQPYHRKASENPPNIVGRETLTGNSGSEISYGHRRVGKLVRTSHRCAHHLQDDEESHSCIGIVSFYTLYKKIFFQENLQNIQDEESLDEAVHKAEAFVQPSHQRQFCNQIDG